MGSSDQRSIDGRSIPNPGINDPGFPYSSVAEAFPFLTAREYSLSELPHLGRRGFSYGLRWRVIGSDRKQSSDTVDLSLFFGVKRALGDIIVDKRAKG